MNFVHDIFFEIYIYIRSSVPPVTMHGNRRNPNEQAHIYSINRNVNKNVSVAIIISSSQTKEGANQALPLLHQTIGLTYFLRSILISSRMIIIHAKTAGTPTITKNNTIQKITPKPEFIKGFSIMQKYKFIFNLQYNHQNNFYLQD